MQGEGGKPPLVKALDSRKTLRSFIGLEPYRRIRIRAGHEAEDLVRDLRNEVSKSGKEVELAEVRGIRISLSTDSQGRDLLLIL